MSIASILAGPNQAAASDLSASFVSQLIPDQVVPGERFKVMVQFRNDGSSPWKAGAGLRLVPVGAGAQPPWNIVPVELDSDASVTPGGLATFAFQVTAPAKAGAYELQWQLTAGGQPLGRPTPVAPLLVGQIRRSAIPGKLGAEFVSQTVPRTMFAGETYRILLVYKNTGGEPWRRGEVSLHPDNPLGNLNWFVDQIDLGKNSVVKPGEIQAFEFDIRAPSEPGLYAFQWRLMHPKAGPFGDASENVEIRVTMPTPR